ncbi:ATP-binding cassette domain-containing protein [Brachyspira pilosicoli]|uniref:ATP-binding cassette domain-containing protein n=1 Tax=Brachyspira pilosicoli TaxID=52584 RepID=A0AAJ6KC05_BRAPL|nr:oligopeptide/dipeptide ABC transporter ATP-binding protein [Brachyspira pilosicoli]MBW5391177.1 ATP-binding cassette domain-containing protein [Brachyspira pilosicoli]WIH90631.1 ATP-binding cassette domain-containing protein [Brachyspira pilosicoli]WIH92922.1 ATP-binding cassette domain-containing protein [Brachyspira pilosicoli]WIH95211.1 ATP-binding cassette domain-containing protein [Brachyspira pilosicoli]
MAPLIEIQDLKQHFKIKGGLFGRNIQTVKAVDGVSFTINKGETFGLVGESGSGKTTLGRTLLHLYKPTSGKIFFNGEEVNENNYRQYAKRMQIIFQDPYASLNPRMTVEDIIGEALDVHKLYSTKNERREKVINLLKLVGLNAEQAQRYPHEFSGGQRQRIGIARALAVDPEFIVCDEPVSALDVSIQAQIINMLYDMQQDMKLTYLFIAHDLAVVRQISKRIAVMYLGNIVELTDSESLYTKSLHPYTQSLISAIPISEPSIAKTKQRIILSGEIPSPINPPSGCKFRTRCPKAQAICAEKAPEFREVESGHYCACHLV